MLSGLLCRLGIKNRNFRLMRQNAAVRNWDRCNLVVDDADSWSLTALDRVTIALTDGNNFTDSLLTVRINWIKSSKVKVWTRAIAPLT